MFCTIFCEISYLDRYAALTRLHTRYIVCYHNFYPSHVQNFFKFLPLYFYRQEKKIFLHSFYFVEFSYLEQFYSFTLAILLYLFFNRMFIGHTCKFWSFFLCIFIEKICTAFTFYFLHSHHGWEGIGFMWKMTFEIFIKSLRFETPWVKKNGFYESVCLSVCL